MRQEARPGALGQLESRASAKQRSCLQKQDGRKELAGALSEEETSGFLESQLCQIMLLEHTGERVRGCFARAHTGKGVFS